MRTRMRTASASSPTTGRTPSCRPRGGGGTPTPAERVATRRAAALALDPLVQRLLPQLAPWPLLVQPALTLYDRIWPATPDVVACWTLSARVFGPVTHSIWSSAVTLVVDARDRPHHFVVSGATTAVTDDVSEAALAAAIAVVRRGRPLHTSSPNAFPFVL